MTTLQDTIRIQSGYITIHVSWTLRPSRAGYTQDTLEIHSRYIKDTYLGSKDGNHYRILEHTTGYIYQQGFPPSATEEPDEEDEVEDKTGGGDGDEGEEGDEEEKEEEEEPPPKKQKGGKGAQAPNKARKAAKRPPQAPSQRASKRGRNK